MDGAEDAVLPFAFSIVGKGCEGSCLFRVTLRVPHGCGTLSSADETGGANAIVSGRMSSELVLQGTPPEINRVLPTLEFSPRANLNEMNYGAVPLHVSVEEISASARRAGIALSYLRVHPVNDAPSISLPERTRTMEDRATGITGVRVEDSDDVGQDSDVLITVLMSCSRGSISVTELAGLQLHSPAESSDLRISGGLQSVNAAMATLVYTPPLDWSGTSLLTVTATDVHGEEATGTTFISVEDEDDLPSLSFARPLLTAGEGDVLAFDSVTTDDSDSESLRVTLSAPVGAFHVNASETCPIGRMSIHQDAIEATIVASAADANAALANCLNFRMPGRRHAANRRTIAITVRSCDSESLSRCTTKSLGVIVDAVDAPPILSSPGDPVVCSADSRARVPGILVADADPSESGTSVYQLRVSASFGQLSVRAQERGERLQGAPRCAPQGYLQFSGRLAVVNAILGTLMYHAGPQGGEDTVLVVVEELKSADGDVVHAVEGSARVQVFRDESGTQAAPGKSFAVDEEGGQQLDTLRRSRTDELLGHGSFGGDPAPPGTESSVVGVQAPESALAVEFSSLSPPGAGLPLVWTVLEDDESNLPEIRVTHSGFNDFDILVATFTSSFGLFRLQESSFVPCALVGGQGSNNLTVRATVGDLAHVAAAVSFMPKLDHSGEWPFALGEARSAIAKFGRVPDLEEITVTVQNSASLHDVESIAVSIMAVNDAPQILGPLEMSVESEALALSDYSVRDADDTFFKDDVLYLFVSAANGTVVVDEATCDLLGVEVNVTDNVNVSALVSEPARDGSKVLLRGSAAALTAALRTAVLYASPVRRTATDLLSIAVSDTGIVGSDGVPLSSSTSTFLRMSGPTPHLDLRLASLYITGVEDTFLKLPDMSISGVPAASELVLALSSDHGTFAWIAEPSVVGAERTGNGTTIRGTAAALLSAAKNLAYVPDRHWHSGWEEADPISVTVTDGDRSTTRTVFAHVAAANDAPEIVAPDILYGREESSVSLRNITIRDVDAGAAMPAWQHGHGQLTLEVTHGVIHVERYVPVLVHEGISWGCSAGSDRVVVEGQITYLNDILRFSTFWPDEDWNSLLTPGSEEAAQLTVSASDGVTSNEPRTAQSVIVPIIISPVVDPPEVHVTRSLSIPEDSRAAFDDLLVVYDPDHLDADVTLRVSTGEGSLLENGAGDFVRVEKGSRSVTLTGPRSAVNEAAKLLIFVPEPNMSGVVVLEVRVSNAAQQSAKTNAFVTVEEADDAPTITAAAVKLYCVSGESCTLGDFSCDDPDEDDTGKFKVSISVSGLEASLAWPDWRVRVRPSLVRTDLVEFVGTSSDISEVLPQIGISVSSNAEGAASIVVAVTDKTGLSAAAPLAAVFSRPAYQPRISLPNGFGVVSSASFSTREDESLDLTGMSIVGAADALKRICVKLQCAEGTLATAASGADGAALLSDLSPLPGELLFCGAMRALNGVLSRISYTPNADFSGVDFVSISSYVEEGIHHAEDRAAALRIAVIPVNDAPTISRSSLESIKVQKRMPIADGGTMLDAGLSVVDVDSPPEALLLVKVSAAEGELSLDAPSIEATAIYAEGATELGIFQRRLVFRAVPAEIDVALAALRYRAPGGFVGSTSISLSVRGDVMGVPSASNTTKRILDVQVMDRNVPPRWLPLENTLLEGTEDVSVPLPKLAFVDDNFLGEHLTLSVSCRGGSLQLHDDGLDALANATVRVGTPNAADEVTALDSSQMKVTASVDALQALLSSGMVFQPTPEFSGLATVALSIADTVSVDEISLQIAVRPVNDVPSVIWLGDGLSVARGTPRALDMLRIRDDDDDNDDDDESNARSARSLFTVTIAPGTGSMELKAFPPGTWHNISSAGNLTLVGSLQSLGNAFRTGLVRYAAAPRTSGGAQDTLKISVTDSGVLGWHDAKSVEIDVAVSVYDAATRPRISCTTAAHRLLEGTTIDFSSCTILSRDAVAGSTMTLSISAAHSPGVLIVDEGLSWWNDTLFEATPRGASLTGTLAHVNALLPSLKWAPPTSFNGLEILVMRLADDAGTTLHEFTASAHVVAVNTGPEIRSATDTWAARVDEDEPFSLAQIYVTDEDALENSGAVVEVTLSHAVGDVALGASTSVADLAVSKERSATAMKTVLRGPVAAINEAFQSLTFTAPQDYHGSVTIAILCSDLGNSGSGGPQSGETSLRLQVVEVNDPPVLSQPSSYAINEDETARMSDIMLFSDADAGDEDIIEFTWKVQSRGLQLILASEAASVTWTSSTRQTSGETTYVMRCRMADARAAFSALLVKPEANWYGKTRVQSTVSDTRGGRVERDLWMIVAPVNDAPSVSVSTVVLHGVEDTVLAVGHTITLSDADAGGGLASAVELWTLDVIVHETGSDCFVQQLAATVEVVSGQGASCLSLRGSLDALSECARHLQIRPPAHFVGSIAMNVQLSDSASSASTELSLVFANINDVPDITGPSTLVQSRGDDRPAVLMTGTSISDADDAEGNQLLFTTLEADDGALFLHATEDLRFVEDTANGGSRLAFRGTGVAVNGALQKISYTASHSLVQADRIHVSCSDGLAVADLVIPVFLEARSDMHSAFVPANQQTAEGGQVVLQSFRMSIPSDARHNGVRMDVALSATYGGEPEVQVVKTEASAVPIVQEICTHASAGMLGGSFTLKLDLERTGGSILETSPIRVDAVANEHEIFADLGGTDRRGESVMEKVQALLEAADMDVRVSFVSRTRTAGAFGTQVWRVTFENAPHNFPLLEKASSQMTGTDADVSVRMAIPSTQVRGSFSLRMGDETTPLIPVDASAELVRKELEALPSLGLVGVSRSAEGPLGTFAWCITFFGGARGEGISGVPLLVADGSRVTGKDATVRVLRLQEAQGLPTVLAISTDLEDADDRAVAGTFSIAYGSDKRTVHHDATAEDVKAAIDSLPAFSAVGAEVVVARAGPLRGNAYEWYIAVKREPKDHYRFRVEDGGLNARSYAQIRYVRFSPRDAAQPRETGLRMTVSQCANIDVVAETVTEQGSEVSLASAAVLSGSATDVSACLSGATLKLPEGWHGAMWVHADSNGRRASSIMSSAATLRVDVRPRVDVPEVHWCGATIGIETAPVMADEDAILHLGVGAPCSRGLTVHDDDDALYFYHVDIAAEKGYAALTADKGATMEPSVQGSVHVTWSKALSLSGALVSINSRLRGLIYRGSENLHGTDRLTITVRKAPDLAAWSVDGAASVISYGPATLTIRLLPHNDAPMVLIDGANPVSEGRDGQNGPTASREAMEDAPMAVTGIEIRDPDVQGGAESPYIRATLSVKHGTLTVDEASPDAEIVSIRPLASTVGANQSSAGDRLELVGALGDVNDALATLSYFPDANWNGIDTLVIAASDQAHGGRGGVQTAEAQIRLCVRAVPDPPEIRLPGGTVEAYEDLPGAIGRGPGGLLAAPAGTAASVLTATPIVIGDPDVLPGLLCAACQGRPSAELDRSHVAANLTASSSVDDGDASFHLLLEVSHGTITLAGSESAHRRGARVSMRGSLDELNQALDGAVYIGDLNYNSAGAGGHPLSPASAGQVDRIFVTVSDADGLSARSSLPVFVNAINDAPHIDVDGASYGSTKTADGRSSQIASLPTISVREDTAAELPLISVRDVDVLDAKQDGERRSSEVLASSRAVHDLLDISLRVDEGEICLAGEVAVTQWTAGICHERCSCQGRLSFRVSGARAGHVLRQLTYTPKADFHGGDTLRVTVNDLGNSGDRSDCLVNGAAQATLRRMDCLENAPPERRGLKDAVSIPIVVEPEDDAPVVRVPTTAIHVEEDAAVIVRGVEISDVDAPHAQYDGSEWPEMPNASTAAQDAAYRSFFTGTDSDVKTPAVIGTGHQGNASCREIRMTVLAERGSVTFTRAPGLTFGVGDGHRDKEVDVRGVLRDLSRAVSSLLYHPDLHWYNDGSLYDTITFTVSDQRDFAMSADAGLHTIAKALVRVAGRNDAPRVVLPGDVYSHKGGVAMEVGNSSLLSTTEDVSLVLQGVSIADVDVVPGMEDAVDMEIELRCGSCLLQLATWDGLRAVPDMARTGLASNLVRARGSLRRINDAVVEVQYQPEKDFNGLDTISITIYDLGAHGIGDALMDARAVPVQVEAVNDAPVWSIPHGALSVGEDSFTRLSSISIFDPDAVTLEFTFAARHGLLTVANTPASAVFLEGDGSADSSMTVQCRAAESALLLGSLLYQAPKHWARRADGEGSSSRIDVLTLVANDGGGSGSISGRAAPLSATARMGIVVAASRNDPPKVLVDGEAATGLRGPEDARIAVSSVHIVDSDADGALGAAVTVTIATTKGMCMISDAAAAGVLTRHVDARTMTIEGSLSRVNAALASLSFLGAKNWYGEDTITVRVSDNGFSGAGGARSHRALIRVRVAPVPDAPVLTGPVEIVKAVEDSFSRIPHLSVTDADEWISVDVNGTPPFDEVDTELELTIDVEDGCVMLSSIEGVTPLRALVATDRHDPEAVRPNASFSRGLWLEAATLSGRPTALHASIEGLLYHPPPNWSSRLAQKLDVVTLSVADAAFGTAPLDGVRVRVSVADEKDSPVFAAAGQKRHDGRENPGRTAICMGSWEELFAQEDEPCLLPAISLRDVDLMPDGLIRVVAVAARGSLRISQDAHDVEPSDRVIGNTSGQFWRASLELLADLATVNAVLAAMEFLPEENYYGDAAQVTVSAVDVHGIGERSSISAPVRVAPVNDAPALVLRRGGNSASMVRLREGEHMRLSGAVLHGNSEIGLDEVVAITDVDAYHVEEGSVLAAASYKLEITCTQCALRVLETEAVGAAVESGILEANDITVEKTALTLRGTLRGINRAVRDLEVRADEDAYGHGAIAFRVTDEPLGCGNTSAASTSVAGEPERLCPESPANEAAAEIEVHYVSVNDAPRIATDLTGHDSFDAAAGAMAVALDTVVTLGEGHVTLSDVDVDQTKERDPHGVTHEAFMTLTVSAEKGRVRVGAVPGIAVLSGSAVFDRVRVVAGKVSDLMAYLAKLQYRCGAPDDCAAGDTDRVSIAVSDNGFTGVGGAKEAHAHVSILIVDEGAAEK